MAQRVTLPITLHLLLASSCLLVAHLLRTSRSALLFPAGVLRGRFNLLLALSIGYAINAVVPFRIGELVRAWFVSRREPVSFAQSTAIVAAERLSDLIVVALLVAAIFPGAFEWVILVGLSAGITLFAFGVVHSAGLRRLIWAAGMPFNDRIHIGIADFSWRLSELVSGGALVRPQYLLRSVLMWALYLLSYALLARVTGLGLGDTIHVLVGTPLHSSVGAIAQGNGPAAVAMLFITLPLAATLVYGSLRHRRILARLIRARSLRVGAPARLRRVARQRFKSANEYELFLIAMFAAPTRAVAGFGLQALDDGFVHRTFLGGSEAVIALVELESRLIIRKFAIGESGDKLKEQTAWLAANASPELPLVDIIGERRGNGFYLYDMPYVVPAADFHDVIHTSPVDRSVAILDSVAERIDAFHRRTAASPADDATIAAYFAAKAVPNARAILDSMRGVLPGSSYSVNGQVLDLNMWDHLLDPQWLMAQIERRATATIHGDLTIENIIVAPERPAGWYLIDPNPGNVFDTPLIDWAKLMQSLHLGYETLTRGAGCSLDGDAIRLPLPRSEAYSVLYRRLIELIGTYCGEDALREIYFHELIHYLRLTPYKIRRDVQQGLSFFACTSLLLDRYLARAA